MKNSQYRSTQTQVKHEILARYLDTWGGIIVRGLSYAKYQRVWKFVYLDCFAYKGKYLGDQDSIFRHNGFKGPVYGSPIIGIYALEKLTTYAASLGIQVATNVILIEKDPTSYHDLQVTLSECGLTNRVQETSNFSTLRNCEIALVNADATTMGDSLVSYTNRSGVWAFYLLDPYGASGIPYDFVTKIIQGEHHDVMINLIYEDLVRKTGMALNKDLSLQHKQLVKYWEKAYGKQNWEQIVVKTLEDIRDHQYWREVLGGVPLDDMNEKDLMTDEELTEVKERAFVYGYQQTLASMDKTVAIKLSALKFPDKDRTMFYLFLTTYDPTGALALNQILYEAKFLEYELRYKYNTLRQIPRGQMSFWDPVQDVPEPSTEDRPKVEEIADEVYRRMKGRKLTKKDVYKFMTDTLFFPSEIDKALKVLKKQGLVIYNDGKLTHRTDLQFIIKT